MGEKTRDHIGSLLDSIIPKAQLRARSFGQGYTIRDSANGTPHDKLTTHLDTDEGARYLGEFALGVNPFLSFPMEDILYDEKIAGSLHLTPGEAYEMADNGGRLWRWLVRGCLRALLLLHLPRP